MSTILSVPYFCHDNAVALCLNEGVRYEKGSSLFCFVGGFLRWLILLNKYGWMNDAKVYIRHQDSRRGIVVRLAFIYMCILHGIILLKSYLSIAFNNNDKTYKLNQFNPKSYTKLKKHKQNTQSQRQHRLRSSRSRLSPPARTDSRHESQPPRLWRPKETTLTP